jgi:hypothetical protein
VADFIEEDRVLTQFGMTGVLGMKSEMARVRREEILIFGADLIDLGRNDPRQMSATMGRWRPLRSEPSPNF